LVMCTHTHTHTHTSGCFPKKFHICCLCPWLLSFSHSTCLISTNGCC